jgi:signal peptidase I
VNTNLPPSTDTDFDSGGEALSPLKLLPAALSPDQQYAWLHPLPPPRRGPCTQPQRSRPHLKQLCMVVSMILLSLLGYFAISRFVITAVEIQGRSMTPTLQDGERYFLNRLAYYWKAPARGDLAVIHDPGHNDCAVKRIVGLPGDAVTIKEGGLYLNGRRLQEPYLVPGTRTLMTKQQERPIHLGPDQYFLLGDNRTCSEDSRRYGPIHRSQIVGLISK